MPVKISEFLPGGEALVGDLFAAVRVVNGVINDYKIDFPGTGIKDAAGNYLVRWLPGSGTNINYVQFTSASSTNPALITGAGADVNVNLGIGAQGTGHAYFTGTGAFGIPVGTTLQQPTGFAGGFRYNSDDNVPEYWDIGASAWVDILSGAVQTIIGVAPISAVTVGSTTTISIEDPLTVPHGGTGNTAFNAFMPILAGTTATGDFQSVSPVGASAGYVLTFTSGAANPTWQPSAITAYTIVQVAHGFSVGQLLYLSGATYALARANSTVTAEVVGTVSEVINANTFVITTVGRITGLSGLTAGGVYWLSDATPGLATLTEPVTVGNVTKPVWIADSATSAYIFQERGKIIPATGFVPLGFNTVSTSTKTMDPFNGYTIQNGVSLVTLSVPPAPAVNDYYIVVGQSSGGWVVQMSGSQVLHFGNQTTSAGGTLTFDNQYDSVWIVCTGTNLFTAFASQGNPTTA